MNQKNITSHSSLIRTRMLPLMLVSILWILPTGCGFDEEQPTPCIDEGLSLPTVPLDGKCCDGLDLIPPKEIIVGIQGICTAKCGNQVCDEQTESSQNCPADCSG